MSQYQTPRAGGVIDASTLVKYVTVVGRLEPASAEDYMKLARLAHEFRKAVLYAVKVIVKGLDSNTVLKTLRAMLNKAYGDSAYKVAKALIEGAKFHGADPRKIEVKKIFIVSEGEASRIGNRNIRFEGIDTVKIKYPFDGSWLLFTAKFGEKYLGLIQEVVELSRSKALSYGARVVFRDGKPYLHVSISMELYLRHFGRGKAFGRFVAGFDLNSDRVNMVIVDLNGRIIDIKTAWFSEVTSHGFPRNRAREARLRALSKLIRYAYSHGVSMAVFEDLFRIKKRRFTKNPGVNRKMMKFAKKQLLMHGIIMCMKYGIKPLLIDPGGTTHSKEHDEAMRRYGLDRHTASAYLIALKALGTMSKYEHP